jgi:hypothetical protein
MAEEGNSIDFDALGGLATTVSSTSSLDTWFIGMTGGHEAVSSEPSQSTTGHLKPSYDPTASSKPQTMPQAIISSVISPAINQFLQAPLPAGLPHMMLPPNQIPMFPTVGDAVAGLRTAGGNSVPEFLYQLTKMLTDDNREIIEWSKGKWICDRRVMVNDKTHRNRNRNRSILVWSFPHFFAIGFHRQNRGAQSSQA